MSLGGIIAKLLGRPKNQSGAPGGDWLDTPEGRRWEAAGEKVYKELETAKVNVHTRRIVLRVGAKLKHLTLGQVVQRIAEATGEPADAVRDHVLFWMEEAGESDDEERDDEADVDVDDAIFRWVEEVRRAYPAD